MNEIKDSGKRENLAWEIPLIKYKSELVSKKGPSKPAVLILHYVIGSGVHSFEAMKAVRYD